MNMVLCLVAQSCLTLCDPMDCIWNSPGQNTGVGSLSLLQGIFPTQESNWGLLHCRQIRNQLSYQGSSVLDLRGNYFIFSPLSMILVVSLSYMAFIVLRHVPSTQFPESFCYKWVLNFVQRFFWIYWDDHMMFFFNLLMWCTTLTDLQILKNPCFPGISLTWSWCMIL